MTTTSTHKTRHVHARRQAHAALMGARLPVIAADLSSYYGHQNAARQVRWGLMWVLHHADLSLPQIGELTGRHHTTVLHALRRIEADTALQAELAPFVQRYATTTRRTA